MKLISRCALALLLVVALLCQHVAGRTGDGQAKEIRNQEEFENSSEPLAWLQALTEERLKSEDPAAYAKLQQARAEGSPSLIQAEAQVRMKTTAEMEDEAAHFQANLQKTVSAEEAHEEEATTAAVDEAQELSRKMRRAQIDHLESQADLHKTKAMLRFSQKAAAKKHHALIQAHETYSSLSEQLKVSENEGEKNPALAAKAKDALAAVKLAKTEYDIKSGVVDALSARKEKQQSFFVEAVEHLNHLRQKENALMVRLNAKIADTTKQAQADNANSETKHTSLMQVDSASEKIMAETDASTNGQLQALSSQRAVASFKVKNLLLQEKKTQAMKVLLEAKTDRLNRAIAAQEVSLASLNEDLDNFDQKVNAANMESDELLNEQLEDVTDEKERTQMLAKAKTTREELVKTVAWKRKQLLAHVAKAKQEIADGQSAVTAVDKESATVDADAAKLAEALDAAKNAKAAIVAQMNAAKNAAESTKAKEDEKRKTDRLPVLLQAYEGEKTVALDKLHLSTAVDRLNRVKAVFLAESAAEAKELEKRQPKKKTSTKKTPVDAKSEAKSLAKRAAAVKKSFANTDMALTTASFQENERLVALATGDGLRALNAKLSSTKVQAKLAERTAMRDVLKASSVTAHARVLRLEEKVKTARIELTTASDAGRIEWQQSLDRRQKKLDIAKSEAAAVNKKAVGVNADVLALTARLADGSKYLAKADAEYAASKALAQKHLAATLKSVTAKWARRKRMAQQAKRAANRAARKARDAAGAVKASSVAYKAYKKGKNNAAAKEAARVKVVDAKKSLTEAQDSAKKLKAKAASMKNGAYSKFLKKAVNEAAALQFKSTKYFGTSVADAAKMMRTFATNFEKARVAELAVLKDAVAKEKKKRMDLFSNLRYSQKEVEMNQKEVQETLTLSQIVVEALEKQQREASKLSLTVHLRAEAFQKAHAAWEADETKSLAAKDKLDAARKTYDNAVKSYEKAIKVRDPKQQVLVRGAVAEKSRALAFVKAAQKDFDAQEQRTTDSRKAYDAARAKAFEYSGPTMPVHRIGNTLTLLKAKVSFVKKLLDLKAKRLGFATARITHLERAQQYTNRKSKAFKQRRVEIKAKKLTAFEAELEIHGFKSRLANLEAIQGLEEESLKILLGADAYAKEYVVHINDAAKAKLAYRDAKRTYRWLKRDHAVCVEPVQKMIETIDAMKKDSVEQKKEMLKLSTVVDKCQVLENKLYDKAYQPFRAKYMAAKAKADASRKALAKTVKKMDDMIHDKADLAADSVKNKAYVVTKTRNALKALKAALEDPDRDDSLDAKRRRQAIKFTVALREAKKNLVAAKKFAAETARVKKEWAGDKKVHEINTDLLIREMAAKSNVALAAKYAARMTSKAKKASKAVKQARVAGKSVKASKKKRAYAQVAAENARTAASVARRALRKTLSKTKAVLGKFVKTAVAMADKSRLALGARVQRAKAKESKLEAKQKKAFAALTSGNVAKTSSKKSKKSSLMEVQAEVNVAKEAAFSENVTRLGDAAVAAASKAASTADALSKSYDSYLRAVYAENAAAGRMANAAAKAAYAQGKDVLARLQGRIDAAKKRQARLNAKQSAINGKIASAKRKQTQAQANLKKIKDLAIAQAGLVGKSTSQLKLFKLTIRDFLKKTLGKRSLPADAAAKVAALLREAKDTTKEMKLARKKAVAKTKASKGPVKMNALVAKKIVLKRELQQQQKLVKKVQSVLNKSQKTLKKFAANLAANKVQLSTATKSIRKFEKQLQAARVKYAAVLAGSAQESVNKIKGLLRNQDTTIQRRTLELAAATQKKALVVSDNKSRKQALAKSKQSLAAQKLNVKALAPAPAPEKKMEPVKVSVGSSQIDKSLDKQAKKDLQKAKMSLAQAKELVRLMEKKAAYGDKKVLRADKEIIRLQLAAKNDLKYKKVLELQLKVAEADAKLTKATAEKILSVETFKAKQAATKKPTKGKALIEESMDQHAKVEAFAQDLSQVTAASFAVQQATTAAAQAKAALKAEVHKQLDAFVGKKQAVEKQLAQAWEKAKSSVKRAMKIDKSLKGDSASRVALAANNTIKKLQFKRKVMDKAFAQVKRQVLKVVASNKGSKKRIVKLEKAAAAELQQLRQLIKTAKQEKKFLKKTLKKEQAQMGLVSNGVAQAKQALAQTQQGVAKVQARVEKTKMAVRKYVRGRIQDNSKAVQKAKNAVSAAIAPLAQAKQAVAAAKAASKAASAQVAAATQAVSVAKAKGAAAAATALTAALTAKSAALGQLYVAMATQFKLEAIMFAATDSANKVKLAGIQSQKALLRQTVKKEEIAVTELSLQTQDTKRRIGKAVALVHHLTSKIAKKSTGKESKALKAKKRAEQAAKKMAKANVALKKAQQASATAKAQVSSLLSQSLKAYERSANGVYSFIYGVHLNPSSKVREYADAVAKFSAKLGWNGKKATKKQ